MLTHIKERVLVEIYGYHYEMANYYLRKMKNNPEDSAKFEDNEKLVKMRLKEA